MRSTTRSDDRRVTSARRLLVPGRRIVSRTLLLLSVTLVVASGLVVLPASVNPVASVAPEGRADAYEQAASATASPPTLTFPSGLTVTGSTTGFLPNDSLTAGNARFGTTHYGYAASDYSPAPPPNSPGFEPVINWQCTTYGTCSTPARTMTFTFNRPVLNPRMHIDELGGNTVQLFTTNTVSARLRLTTAGITPVVISGRNIQVTSGTTIEATNKTMDLSCSTSSNPPGCGTVELRGLVTSVTFDITMFAALQRGASNPTVAPLFDGFPITFTVPQDYGDAPSSYDQGDAARAVLSDVKLGPTVTEDNANVADGTTSPNASATASLDGGDDGVTLPPITRATTTYAVPATNTGDVSLDAVTIAEQAFTGAGDVSPLTCTPAQPATLAPGAVLRCTATYDVEAADVVQGVVVNEARATGTDPAGTVVTDDDDATLRGIDAPVLTFTKVADPPVDVDGDGRIGARDQIGYRFTVANDGPVPVDDIEVVDPLAGSVTCDATSLAPGASTACVADAPYVITAADEGAGEVRNVARATGTDPGGATVTSNDDETLTPLDPIGPGLVITKEVVGEPVPGGDGAWTVRYEIRVRNVGASTTAYDLTDTLRPGAGMSVLSTAVAPVAPAARVNAGWDGITDTLVAEAVDLAASAEHRYDVVATLSVPGSIDAAAADCELADDEEGTGFRNEAEALPLTSEVPGVAASACAPVGAVTLEKELVGAPHVGADGTVAARYRLDVRNLGARSARYDLRDDLGWAVGVEITGAALTATPPGVEGAQDWDGRDRAVLATDVALAPGEHHRWEVVVTGRADLAIATDGADCERSATETGTGLDNEAIVSSNGVRVRSEACAPLDPSLAAGADPGGGGQPDASDGPEALPRTGADPTATVLVGLLCVGIGGVLRRRARRQTGAAVPG